MPLSTLTLTNIIEHADNLEEFLCSTKWSRSKGFHTTTTTTTTKTVSRVEEKLGSKVMFAFFRYFMEVPMATIAMPDGDLTISLWRECHANPLL